LNWIFCQSLLCWKLEQLSLYRLLKGLATRLSKYSLPEIERVTRSGTLEEKPNCTKIVCLMSKFLPWVEPLELNANLNFKEHRQDIQTINKHDIDGDRHVCTVVELGNGGIFDTINALAFLERNKMTSEYHEMLKTFQIGLCY
jgi:hypothetical protein